MSYIYAGDVDRARRERIMLPEEQLPGETSRSERGDAVKNVYKAARGRTAGDRKNNSRDCRGSWRC